LEEEILFPKTLYNIQIVLGLYIQLQAYLSNCMCYSGFSSCDSKGVIWRGRDLRIAFHFQSKRVSE